MSKLIMGAGLSLPLEAATEKLGFLGRTGSGKTYAAQKLAEEMHRVGAQFVAIDPVGKWWSLRLAADGKKPGIPIPVFGGLQGDVPLEPTAGKLVADLVADRGISVVLDVSQFESDAAKNRFAKDFGDRFFFRKKSAPSAVHLFLEEAQEFVPQNPMGDGDKQVLHVFTRIWKLGRNFGIGGSLITQRPQEVNKKVLNLTEILFAFQLTGTHERESVAKWIEEKGLDLDVEALLPKLRQGEPHVWSPVLLNISKTVKVGAKWTFDASSTPKVGARAEARPLAPIDLERIRQDMAATIEKAKAEDPKELRRRIAELEREKRYAKPAPAASSVAVKEVQKRVEVPILKDGQLKRLEQISAKLVQVGEVVITVGREITAALTAAHKASNGASAVHREAIAPSRVPRPSIAPASAVRPAPNRPSREPVAAEGISGPEQKILNALAWLSTLGYERPSKLQVALVAGYRIGGAFNNPLGRLRGSGLVTYPREGFVALTETGSAVAVAPDRPLTAEDVQEMVLARLDGPMQKILATLLGSYPDPIAKEALAEATGYAIGGAFNNPLGRLRTMGLIDYPEPGQVVALPVLFLEEAR